MRSRPNSFEWTNQKAPSLDDFARLADVAFAALPKDFRDAAGDIVFRVEEFADDETLAGFDMEDPFELTGLYSGIDLSRRSILDTATEPAEVYLYRRPILDEWCERGDVGLAELIGHVLVHEIGHHFGLSDEDIERIEASAE